jgi:hypothetical protein
MFLLTEEVPHAAMEINAAQASAARATLNDVFMLILE